MRRKKNPETQQKILFYFKIFILAQALAPEKDMHNKKM